MKKALFVNHLRLGSASSYRQAGLAKYLLRMGTKCGYLGRGPAGWKGHSSTQERRSEEEWSYFDKINYWNEPLVKQFFSNVIEFKNASTDRPVIHVNRAYPYTASILASSRSDGRKLVVDMEDWDGFGGYATFSSKYGPSGGLLTVFEQTFPRTADAVLVVSRMLRKIMLKSGVPKEKILLVPNGYDPELFHYRVSGAKVREEYSLSDSPVVMYASTFWDFERSQHEIALKTFRAITKSVPDVKFLVVGSGNMKMKDLVSQFGLGDNVIPTGFVPRNVVPQLMAAADVAFHVISPHPFHAASSPMIISEYMAMGKPIVAPLVGELEVMLKEGAGYLVQQVDPELLASGVVRLIKDERLREDIGRKASMVAAESYSYAVLARNLQSTYNSLLN